MISILFRKHFLLYLLFAATISSFSQKTVADSNSLAKFNETLKLYSDKAYAEAQTSFKVFKNNPKSTIITKSNAAYYDAMCSIKLNEVDADKKVLNFVKEYPNSNKKNLAFYNVANYYFANRKVAYALKWYNKIDIDKISQENRNEVNFKMGYCYLIANEFTLAKSHFIHLINNPMYGNDSRYYYGYIAYKLEDYGLAESTLKEIEDNDTYRIEISYYLLDINFKAGHFKRCLVIGKELIKDKKRDDHSEISKIIGESYFNLKKYKEAIPYLKNYKGRDGKWTNTDFYQLGYAYYKQNNFNEAINNFNKIIDQKNAIAQNAYYHLAECYLKLSKKTEALSAFKTASEMHFDYKIREDAALNYAKLSYEEGNPFRSVAEILQEYLQKYPKSTSYNEISQLVISSFIYQQDYEGALNFLAKNKSKNNLQISYEISLYRGIQLFNDNEIEKSLPFFINSSKSLNKEISDKAKYWEAEALYRSGSYKKALNKFISLKSQINTNEVFKLIDYNIGYCNFKLANYIDAAKHFEKYILEDAEEGNSKDDALVRLGDSYFASKKYEKAIYAYNEVVKSFGLASDYAQYQIGMIYGFIGENSLKVEYLEKVLSEHKSSDLQDDALFQIAISQISLKENEKAIETYSRLLKEYPRSVFYPKVLVRQGLLLYNNNELNKALKKFKQVANDYPNSQEAFEAVANARNVYIDKGNLDDYVSWISSLKFINITNSDIDNTTFEVAEKRYFESNVGEEIIKNLTNYTTSFPDGIHKLKANYYLADILFKVKEYKRAIPYYIFVINEEQNEYSEDALLKLTQVYLKDNNFNDALPYLDRLEQEAYEPTNILYAQSNLMKGYFETEAYDFSIEYAKKLLAKEKISKELVLDAKITIARASYKNEDLASAEEFFLEVEEISTGKLKAETLYYSAYFKNKSENYTDSNKVIQKLIANYSTYKKWAVRSYVIMGKNYYGLNDVYQATYVLENIIKNFKQYEDIIEEAQTELKTIKSEESKRNESIVKPE